MEISSDSIEWRTLPVQHDLIVVRPAADTWIVDFSSSSQCFALRQYHGTVTAPLPFGLCAPAELVLEFVRDRYPSARVRIELE